MNNSPHTSPRHHHSDEEFCHYSIRVLDHISGKSSCMLCFVNLGATSDISKFDLLVEHHLVKGLPASLHCEYCNKNLTKQTLIIFCPICRSKYIKLLLSFRSRQIDVRQVNFRFDVLNERIVTLKRK